MTPEEIESETFQCALCGEVFEKARTHEECLDEHRLHFKKVPVEEMAIVCDSCWKRVHPGRN